MFMARSLNVMPKITEQHFIVAGLRSDKSEAEVNTRRRVRSMYCTIEANY